jgi:pimeloyl-ACP methyl ester carboxylesterase
MLLSMSKIHSHPIFLTPQRINPDYPLFIFLPGMDGTGQLLRTQTVDLKTALDVRCLAIPADDLTKWEVLTDRVVGLIREEIAKVPDRPVYLCGESFGGCLAMQVALHSPHLFDRIILINPASSFISRPWLAWGGHLARWVPSSLFHLSSVTLMPLLGHMDRIALGDRQAFYDAVQSVPQSTILWRMSLLAELNIPDSSLRQLNQSVLLIASAADRLLPSVDEVSRLSKLLPNSQVVVLPKSGHACLLEADVNLFQIMASYDFLMQQATAPSSR